MKPDEARLPPETPSPLSATERSLAVLWHEALQLAELPHATDNFFALGGDSMTMTMVEFRINEELSVELPAGTLLRAQSLSGLAALVDAARVRSKNALTEPDDLRTT